MEINRDSILSIIAHDLKDPVASVSGIAGILLNHWSEFGEEEKREILHEIRDTSDTTLRLLTDLLEWSKQLTDLPGPSASRFPVRQAVDGVIAPLQPVALRKGIRLENRLPADLSLVTDERMFTAVIRNLLTNSVKSCQHGGEISVSAETGSGTVTFCIEDNGIGMEPERIRTLFTGTSGNGSNGFGLLLCRDFVSMLGGTIRAESREGQGTRVFVSFPG